MASALAGDPLAAYRRDGFVKLPAFADAGICEAMLARVVEIAEAKAADPRAAPGLLLPEANLAGRQARPAELASKIFRLHRETPFREFALCEPVLDLVGALVGPDIDCFLSQFIFKNPGAWGQPWHQDSYYFPFEPARPVVGVWLAVTEATLDNGCLHVLPGSQREPIHAHVPDRRPGANYGYVEIVDRDTRAAVPVLMQQGDLLVFDSHLMHRSTDNVSRDLRAAMVYHYAAAGTLDRSNNLVNDWLPARRSGPRAG